jgi:hypothetical protein
MAEIDALVEEQVDATIYDIHDYFVENFAVNGEAMQLNAKIAGQTKGDNEASYSEIIMIVTAAIASIAVFFW